VDFPAFFSGLVRGAIQAIVDASVQQMDACADLLKPQLPGESTAAVSRARSR